MTHLLSGDELSVGSHLVPSCYFWGRALSPLLDSGKSIGYTLARRENMASTWDRREILVVAVHYCLYPTAWLGTALAKAEYINKLDLFSADS